MLSELTIERFKTVREETLQFGRVNLFIGGNGTGKSNLLEAIGLASACLGRGLGDSDIGQRGLRITPPELMKSSFKNEDLPKTLMLEAKFSSRITYKATLQSREGDPLLRFFSESASIRGKKVFGRSNRGASATGVSHAHRLEQHRGIWDQIKATYDIDESAAAEFSEFSRFSIYTPQPDFLRGRQAGRVDNPPIGLHGEGLPEAASGLLSAWRSFRRGGEHFLDKHNKKIIDDCVQLVGLPGWASEFGTHRPAPLLTSRDMADRTEIVYFVDCFMHARRNQLSVYDSSEGTLFLLFAAILLSHPGAPKVFAFDNVDNALNPKLTRSLVEQIIKVCKTSSENQTWLGAKQVFLTSHNPTALDAFDLFDNDNRVFVVKRGEKGFTTATRLKVPKGMSRERWEAVKGGRNLSQLWLDGDIPGALGVM
ncbi:AAA family ATPase [Sphingomonas yantingensis]|uniref:ATPase AAA-type core domain-containing protein n=1 Tax=Sphingomonas yantingensis TaxID=1241761 RepID=A0A7W9AQQ9_9SPHN|nr:ATP-binding protein [Sphingomonas yantingensis]MBB5698815.1 hypothetical protein [Sphingomonas yantingensis]